MPTPLEQNLFRYLDRLVRTLRKQGHPTPVVAVASWAYRWIKIRLGDVRG